MQNKYFNDFLSTLNPDEAEQLKERYNTDPEYKKLIDLIPTLSTEEKKAVLSYFSSLAKG